MIKSEEEHTKQIAIFRFGFVMTNQSLNHWPAISCLKFQKYYITESFKTKPSSGGINELMYAAQRGDVEKVKNLVIEKVCRLSGHHCVDIFLIWNY